MIELRVAEPSDLDWLVELHSRADFNRWTVRLDVDQAAVREEVEAMLALNVEGRGCVVVATLDGVPVGYGAVVLAAGSGRIEYGVEPARQGRGIGGVLLDGLVALGRYYGTPQLYAAVHRLNAPSIRLLLLRGFERSGAWEASPGLFDIYVLELQERIAAH